MKLLFKLTTALFLLPSMLFSQSNYKPGYVVNLKGDTLKGFIDYQEWAICPEAIKFKKTIDGERYLYGVNDISFFNVDDVDEYKRFTVSISNAEVDPNKLEYIKDTTFRTATVFLRVLQRGSKVALYSYADKIKARYYIGEAPDFTPKELIFQTYLNRNYESSNDAGAPVSRTITENTFQRQLNDVALRLNETTDKLLNYIHKTEYTEDDMLKVASKLNHIDRAAFVKKNNKKAPYEFIVGAGFGSTNTEPSGIRERNLDGQYYTSVLPFASAGVTLFPNANTRRLMFRFELVFNSGEYHYFTTYHIVEGSFVPQVLFNIYNGQDLKIFAGIGLGFNKYFYSNANYAADDFATSGILKGGVQIGEHLAFHVQYVQNSSAAHYTFAGLNYMFK